MHRRAKKVANHTEEKVPWASFADALTGLLFVFILLALSFAHQLQKAKEEMEAARNAFDAKTEEAARKVEQAQRARKIAQDLVNDSDSAENRQASVARCLQRAIGVEADAQVQPSPTLDEGRLSLYLYNQSDTERLTIEWFPSGQATLAPGPCEVARQIGPCLEQALEHPELAKDEREFQLRVFVEGHTDAVPVTNGHAAIPTNWELSGARAAAVVRAFLVPPTPGGQQVSCSADPNVATALERRIAGGDLEVEAVGLAYRRPAWKRLCEELTSDPVCGCLEQIGNSVNECHAELREDTRQHNEDTDTLPAEQLIAWANRATPGAEDVRRRLQRRVDLRFEVTPRETTEPVSEL